MISKEEQRSRGQSLPDYAIAFGLFFIAVTIAFGSASELFSPYQTTEERIAEGNKLANRLVSTTFLAEGNNQYIGDQDCTVTSVKALKGKSVQLLDKCSYTNDIDDLSPRDYFGIPDRRGFNVTIIDETDSVITLDGERMEFGQSVPDVADTTNSYRMAGINNNLYRVRVITW